MAKDEYGLTTNQRAFADEYIANKGNATQAYIKAYPNVKKQETAKAAASRLLTDVNVSAYIANVTEEILKKAKMTNTEVITTLTRIARREVHTSYTKQYDHLSGETIKEITYTFQPTIEEQTKALDLLAKYSGLDNPMLNLSIRKQELEIEKLKQQVSGESGQDERLAEYITMLKGAVMGGG